VGDSQWYACVRLVASIKLFDDFGQSKTCDRQAGIWKAHPKTTGAIMPIHLCGLGRESVQRALYSPRETEAILGISHATLYRLIDKGRLDARKIDGKTVITDDSIRQFIADLPRAKSGEAA